jgi:hypothetical protein
MFYCLYCILHLHGVLDIVCQYIIRFYKEGIICFIIIAITTFFIYHYSWIAPIFHQDIDSRQGIMNF